MLRNKRQLSCGRWRGAGAPAGLRNGAAPELGALQVGKFGMLRLVTAMMGGVLGVAAMAAGSAQAADPALARAPAARPPAEICVSVLGLEPGQRSFQDCADSLARSAASQRNAIALQQARRDCLAKGLQPGAPALAQCEVAATAEDTAPRARALPVSAVRRDPKLRSYFDVSAIEAHQRQRMACAELGFEPTAAGFYGCVADLQSVLFEAEHPSN